MIVEISGAPERSTRERVLAFIRVTQAIEGAPPSYREIAKGLGLTNSSVMFALDELRNEDLVFVSERRARTLHAAGEPLVVRVLPVAVTSEERIAAHDERASVQ